MCSPTAFWQGAPESAGAWIDGNAANYGRWMAGIRCGSPYSRRSVARMVRDGIYRIDLGNTDYPRRWAALRTQADRLLALWGAECPDITSAGA